jgi:hypothetical protein
MKARIIFVLIVFGLSLGLATTSAKAGPPWPAIVIKSETGCWTSWMDDELKNETWIPLTLHEVYQPHNGIMNVSCHGTVDFSSPEYATITDICTHPEIGWTDFCNGNGSMSWNGYPIWCVNEYGDLTYDTSGVLSPSGKVLVSCHYKGVYH